MKRFHARWSKPLIAVSAAGTLVCLVAGATALHYGRLIGIAALALPAAAALFSILGYRIDDRALLVRRLLWDTRIALAGMRDVQADATLIEGAWRTFGNGGLFSYSGWHRSRKLGSFRALMTNTEDVVVLRFDTHTLVVTPHPPAPFVDALRDRIGAPSRDQRV